MKTVTLQSVLVGCLLFSATAVRAQDWPQWRGPNRDGRVTGFSAPKTWPKELTQKWKVAVGDGVATPALVGDKLYVFSRESGNEVIRCLSAETGKELWQDKYETGGASGPAASFSGPRCSPAVAAGKVVTLGVRGILSCLDAASGKVLWRKETGNTPRFCTSSSPLLVDGLCIAQIGSERNGSVVAYELAGGKEKWKATGSTAYASPVLLTLSGTKVLVAETDENIVGLSVADGKQLWKTPFGPRGMRSYNASTPVIAGDLLVYSGSGRGTHAVKLEKKDAELAGKELWNNSDNSVQYNTPVVKDGLVFGLSDRNSLFCINARDGKTAWTSSVAGGGRRQQGYGGIVDAGPVLLALTPAAQLIVFQPSDKKFEQVASYKVGDSGTYGDPVVAGNRIFVKDRNSLYLWTIE